MLSGGAVYCFLYLLPCTISQVWQWGEQVQQMSGDTESVVTPMWLWNNFSSILQSLSGHISPCTTLNCWNHGRWQWEPWDTYALWFNKYFKELMYHVVQVSKSTHPCELTGLSRSLLMWLRTKSLSFIQPQVCSRFYVLISPFILHNNFMSKLYYFHFSHKESEPPGV